jgi:ArsR family transcriptional regulator
VTELVAEVGLSQPLVSWHVGRLRTAGLVATRRIGRETVCSVQSEAFEAFATRQRSVLGLSDAESTDPARSAAS